MLLGNYLKDIFGRLGKGDHVGEHELAGCLSISVRELHNIPLEYTRVLIPKRSGRNRVLHVPNPELKLFQSRIYRRLLLRLPVHQAAVGFKKGSSIVQNAERHVSRALVLGLDIEDFFTSTASDRIYRFFKSLGWNSIAAGTLTRLCCVEHGLPQGSPTSPVLSNLVNYRLDCRFTGLAESNKLTYTRYADDISISFGDDSLGRVGHVLQSSAKILFDYGYSVNASKTRFMRRHQRQVVTGLTVNNAVSLPRPKRRMLRSALHRISLGREATLTTGQINGLCALQKQLAQLGDIWD